MQAQLVPQIIEEHTITLVLPSTEQEASTNYDQLQAEIKRLIASACQRHHSQRLTYYLNDFLEIDGEQDLHIYQLQIMG